MKVVSFTKLEVEPWGRHELFIVIRGKETFYNQDDEMIVHETEEEAREWAKRYLQGDPEILSQVRDP